MKPHPLLALILLARLAGAQSAVGAHGTTPIDLSAWPSDWSARSFAPLVDGSGRPVARRIVAAGSTDFDADGNDDLWFLTESSPGQTQVHALLANTGDLGRYWPWSDYAPSPLPDAATYRSRDVLDMVVAVDPTTDRLSHHFFVPNLSGPDPRIGGYWGRTPGWQLGAGCYEIETHRARGCAHDDIVVLRDAGNGTTELEVVLFDNPFGGQPTPQHEVRMALPNSAQRLRALDFDGDGRTDAACELPGIGVVVLRAGEKSLAVDAFLPLPVGVRDFCTGDLDGDGADELGVVADGGVIVLSRNSTTRLLANPAGAAGLAAARFADIDRDGALDVVASPLSGDGLVVHLRRGHDFMAPILHVPVVPPPAGNGTSGLALMDFDVDHDGDADLAVQMRDASWVVLHADQRSLTPIVVNTTHEGRFGENYISERLDFALPSAWATTGIDHVEVGIYMRHPTQPNRPWVLWGHTEFAPNPAQPQLASVRMLYLVDLSKLNLLTSAYLYPQGFAVSGDTLLTVHGKVGSVRYQSMLVFHEGRGDENKSTLGVQWKVIAAPPLPRADAQLLPF
ncbi:MAG: VCBS repeat-containing protein [Planctomycetota bacterium]